VFSKSSFEIRLSPSITSTLPAGSVHQNSYEEYKRETGKFRLKAAHLTSTFLQTGVKRMEGENNMLFTDFTTPIRGIFVIIIYFICLSPWQLSLSCIKKLLETHWGHIS